MKLNSRNLFNWLCVTKAKSLKRAIQDGFSPLSERNLHFNMSSEMNELCSQTYNDFMNYAKAFLLFAFYLQDLQLCLKE